MKNDVYQVITDRIIRLLEAGTVPWHQPWKGGDQAPRNFISRKAYRGINLFLLHAARYSSPYWLTFRQVQGLGARVKKGEHSFPVVFWKIFEDERDEQTKRIPMLRFYSVFNIAQCEAISVPEPIQFDFKVQPIEKCVEVVERMPSRPAITHGRAGAFYHPIRDEICLPEMDQFESAEAYYSTLFHELTHSTGHQSRLNRPGVSQANGFGSDLYSREELIAEMGAAFLCGHCGISKRTVDQSASYIGNWLARLKDDRKLVVQAGAQAQKASDLILAVTHDGMELPESESG